MSHDGERWTYLKSNHEGFFPCFSTALAAVARCMLSVVVAPSCRSLPTGERNYNPLTPIPLFILTRPAAVTPEKRTRRISLCSCSSHASQPSQFRRVPHLKSGGDSSQVLKLVGAPKRKKSTEGGRKSTPALDTNIKPVFCEAGPDTDRAEASKTGLLTHCPQCVLVV